MIRNYFSNIPDFNYSNFKYLFDDVTRLYVDSPAFRMKGQGNADYSVWTYGRMRAETYALASWFRSRGLVKGDAVGILSENRPEWAFAYFAAVVSGLVVVPIDAMLEADSVRNNVVDSKLRLLCYSSKQEAKLARVREDTALSAFLCLDEPLAPDAARYADVIGTETAADLPGYGDIKSDDVAAIIFTSGTTGIAKGIQLTHRNIIANINAAIQALLVDSTDVFIGILPFHHTYACTCSLLAPLTVGGSITISERVIAKVIMSRIAETGVSFFITVPIILDKLKQGIETKLRDLPFAKRGFIFILLAMCQFFGTKPHWMIGRRVFGSLRKTAGIDTVRMIVSGGGPLAPQTADFFEALGFVVVQGYGMSENSPLISVNVERHRDNRSVGLPVKYAEVRIAEAGADGVGEIQVRSPSVMRGYLDAPEATAEAITADGWLRTGDLGYIDRRGFIYITGRSKNIIVTEGGKNIYPEEIEQKFVGSRVVLEVLVLGRKIRPNSGGEDVIAVCVPDWESIKADYPEASISMEFARELIRSEVEEINKTLPPYKKITDLIMRETEFEKNSSRKIRRFLYREYSKPVAR
jgi:long-chain acyl-CoA synthetase